MGSSGAGKTSLLNILCDRVRRGLGKDITGKVLINETVEMTQEVFGDMGGYVMQDDILYSHFTPREALRFAARLKLKDPKNV